MSAINKRSIGTQLYTFEGGRASHVSPAEALRRSMMCNMLWEDNFYEDGQTIAERIETLAEKVKPDELDKILLEAKFDNKLRHAPLLLMVKMASLGCLKKETVAKVLTRPDDMTELLAIYFNGKKKPIAKSILKGLALAFGKFSEYELAKYNRKKEIKLRDILKLSHPKAKDEEQAKLWGRLLKDELATPDTWEVKISACTSDEEKRFEYTLLLKDEKLGDLAFLRNLRKMTEVGVEKSVILDSFSKRKFGKMLPFQFITAAKYAPDYEAQLEKAMLAAMDDHEKFDCSVKLLVDVSGSMNENLSAKSELTRLDAAKGLAMLLREIVDENKLSIYTFNNDVRKCRLRKGFALNDEIGHAGGGTQMWTAIKRTNNDKANLTIVITDEQTQDNGVIADAETDLFVIINVGTHECGVAYGKGSLHLSGWSERIIDYLQQYIKS